MPCDSFIIRILIVRLRRAWYNIAINISAQRGFVIVMDLTITAAPMFKPENPWRNCTMVGVRPFGDEIVFVRVGIEEDVPRESVTPDTVYTSCIMADFFGRNLDAAHSEPLKFRQKPYPSGIHCECYNEGGRLFLKTLRYKSHRNISEEWRTDHFAKVYEIQAGGIVCAGLPPEPDGFVYTDARTFTFDGYSVSMASPFKVRCMENGSGKELWTLKVNAYLYTDFVLIGGILYFGTAGSGGHFYGVCPEDGTIAVDINTGGTTCFFRIGEKNHPFC
jgi:hypothetical protein